MMSSVNKLLLAGCCVLCSIATASAQSEYGSSETGSLPMETVQSQHKDFWKGTEAYFSQLPGMQGQKISSVVSAVDSYVDFFANQDYSKVPEWEVPILSLVKEGMFGDALTLYERQNLPSAYRAGQPVYESLERYVMLLELSGVRSNATKGLEIMQNIVGQDSVMIRPLTMIVNIATDLRMTALAEEYITLFQLHATGNPELLAQAYSLRAQNSFRRSKPNEALRYGQYAVTIYDSLFQVSKRSPFETVLRARLSLTMGRILARLDNNQTSIEHLRRCWYYYADAAREDSAYYITERVRSLYAAAPLAAELKAYELADSIYKDVDRLGYWFFEGRALQESQFYFNSLRLRGLSAYHVGDHTLAHSYFDQAAEILAKMEELAPGQNLEAHENLNFNIASVYYAEGNFEKALECDIKVLEMVLKDKEHDARRHNSDLSYCYKYIGNCHWAIGYQKYLAAKKKRTKEVMGYYRVARDNYAKALTYNPNDLESISKYNLGDLIVNGMEKPMAMPSNF